MKESKSNVKFSIFFRHKNTVEMRKFVDSIKNRKLSQKLPIDDIWNHGIDSGASKYDIAVVSVDGVHFAGEGEDFLEAFPVL